MRLKKEIISKLIILVILLLSIISILTVFYHEPKQEETIVEEEIEVVPYSDYDWSCLSGDQKLTYEDDNYTSMFGIDVSTYQNEIDWQKVKESGVEFAYIRLGYRGAVEGKLNIDRTFEYNYANAIKNDIKVGIYWYSQPISTQEAFQEAEYVLEVLNDRHLDLPIVYDFEETEFSDGTLSRMHGMSRQDRTSMAETFCNYIKNKGYDCAIYTYLYWSKKYYDWERLENIPVWFAQYKTDYPEYDRPFIMWQYSNTGTIDGIDAPVDLDILFIRKNDQN